MATRKLLYTLYLEKSQKEIQENNQEEIRIIDDEFKNIFKGVMLKNEEVLALNGIISTNIDLKCLKSAIRALKGQQTTNVSRNSGRKKKSLPVSKEIVELRHSTGESYGSIAKSYDMSRTTLYYLINDIE